MLQSHDIYGYANLGYIGTSRFLDWTSESYLAKGYPTQ